MRTQALHVFRKQPGFAAIVMATLAAGIGASTAVFSLLNAVALRPFAFPDPDRLIHLSTPNRNLPEVPAELIGPSAADFFDWQRQARSFSQLALFEQASFNVASGSVRRAAARRTRSLRAVVASDAAAQRAGGATRLGRLLFDARRSRGLGTHARRARRRAGARRRGDHQSRLVAVGVRR